MPGFAFSASITINLNISVVTSNFVAGSVVTVFESGAVTVGDDDSTGSITIGDSAGSAQFLGHNIVINGEFYAAWFSPGQIIIPHNGTLSAADFPPASGIFLNISYSDAFSGAFANCFAEGTLIATPKGGVSVEELNVGDVVRTACGGHKSVLWVGHQKLHKLFHGPHMQPVRIRAGALGGGLPHSDLTVTADHGMVIDGLVINASALVNGDTIDFVPMEELEDSFTVYHIETEDHDVILANGAPSETFVDAAGRNAFDNYHEYLDLYGAERIIPEMDRPRISSQRLVPQSIKSRLAISTVEFSSDHWSISA